MTYRQFCYSVLLLWSIRTLLSQAIKKIDVSEVDRCPTDLTSWEKASRDLNCTPADRYQCTSNQHRTALVEFCYDEPTTFVTGGHCWILLDSNFVDIYNCSGFTDGCPNTTYRSDELYKYQKCLQLDKLKGCFRADAACLEQREVTTVTPSATEDSANEMIIRLVTIGIVIILLAAISFILFILKKRGLLPDCNCNTRDIPEVRSFSLLPLCVTETVRIEAIDPLKKKFTEKLTDISISILNHMKNSIQEATQESEIDKRYESIEEFNCENKDGGSILESSPFFIELDQKIESYADSQENRMQILLNFFSFTKRLHKYYGGELNSSRGSLLLKLTFSSERGYDLYMKDSETGEIGKLILDVLLYPPYLANFDLHAEDLIIYLNDKELTAENNSPLSKYPAIQISSITIPGVEGVTSISVLTSDRLWVSASDGRLMQVDSTGPVLLDNQRDKVDERYTGSHTVTGDGDLLFIDNNLEVRKLISDGTVTTFLATDSTAFCIHSSRVNGDILVGIYETVTRYNRTGRELQVIKKNDKGQGLYESPYYITENKNGDVWISDQTKHAVVVVDKSGRHRFDYTGRQSDFSPRGICTDVLGHVLVCDEYNDSVHLLDKDGQFLSLLLTPEQHGIRHPVALCVDDQHNIYLGQRDSNTINVYAYLQDTDVK